MRGRNGGERLSTMKRVLLIVGLGNPGREYERTRHNAGWVVVDEFAAAIGAGPFRKATSLESMLLEATDGECKLVVCKPLTYMNLSGRAVASAAERFRVAAEDVIVVHDELDLPLGRLKMRLGGGTAGHKGVASVADHLGERGFWRLRVGIFPLDGDEADAYRRMSRAHFVLSRFSSAEWDVLREEVVPRAVEGLRMWCRPSGRDRAVEYCNRRVAD